MDEYKKQEMIRKAKRMGLTDTIEPYDPHTRYSLTKSDKSRKLKIKSNPEPKQKPDQKPDQIAGLQGLYQLHDQILGVLKSNRSIRKMRKP